MSFAARLFDAVHAKGSPAVLGLDPRPAHLPEPFASRTRGSASQTAQAIRDFHRALIGIAAGQVAAVKPNAAFFEALGPPGWEALADAVECAQEHGLLVLMDAKRGDIGSTAEAYAQAFLLGGLGGAFPPSDALTLNPYLGPGACQPFLEAADHAGAGLFFLVKTSNPDAEVFQAHGTPPLADLVAAAVDGWGRSRRDDSGWSSVGAVVGATRQDELQHFRDLMPHAPLLLPGFGFQGGAAAGLEAAFDTRGRGAVVSASRSLAWAHERQDLAHLSSWEEKVQAALAEMLAAVRPLIGARP